MRVLLSLLTVLLLAPVAVGQGSGSRYQVQGVGPEGSYEGTAVLSRGRVVVKTYDGSGRERITEADARRRGSGLRFTSRSTLECLVQRPLRATLRAIEGERSSLVATYRDAEGQVVRRECWLRSDRIRIPLQVVALSGDERFPAVSAEQALEAQTWILGQLSAVFGPLDVEFAPITAAPERRSGAAYDLDRDGQLSLEESRGLRDALEREGLKRSGRVLLVLTRSGFADRIDSDRCRGWTLGDASATPHSLDDLNDNFSIVGLRYLDPNRFHTVAHEVAHQLGLDDVTPQNRHLLAESVRKDHLMISGGTGLYLDARVSLLLRRTSGRFPDHGLEGRMESGWASRARAHVAPASLEQGLPPAVVAPSASVRR